MTPEDISKLSEYEKSLTRKKIELLKEVEYWSEKYLISFQFWGKGNNNVFIEKDDVELTSMGGSESMEEIMQRAVSYIREINGLTEEEKTSNHESNPV